MTERVDRNQASQTIDRQNRVRARESQKKQASAEFGAKLETQEQLGSNARAVVQSKQVLEQVAKGEEAAKANIPEKAGEVPVLKKALSQEKSQKTDQKKTEKDSAHNKQIDKKNEKVSLDIAVQKKQQQEQDSGEFGGSSGGDFFQQAVSMGMATQKAEAVLGGPVKVPDEVLNQIVDQVYSGVNAEGVSQFVIDFKPGVLGGGRMTISANKKSVVLKFSGLDAKSKRSLKSAQGDLRNRLAGKGLDLENLEIG